MKFFHRPTIVLAICYVVLVGACSLVILRRNSEPAPGQPAEKEIRNLMSASDDWQIQPQPEDVDVLAKPSGLWTLAYEYVRGPALIRFGTNPEQKWNYASKSRCTADGDPASMISSQACVLPGAPVGALIAKIGGSTAGQADGKVILVGSFAIVEIDANTRGPIFLTINDEVSGMDNNSGSLKVRIRIKPVTASSQQPGPGNPAKP